MSKENEHTEKRSLKRVLAARNDKYNLLILIENIEYKARLVDFNSKGLFLHFIENPPTYTHIKSIKIFFGKMQIAEFENPKIIRKNENFLSVAIIKEKNNLDDGKIRKKRIDIKNDFRPYVFAKDPFKSHSNLHLIVCNINAGGIMARSSLSNHHLMPFAQLKFAQIILPGIGILTVDLFLRYIEVKSTHLEIGLIFQNPSSELLKKLAQFTTASGIIEDGKTEEILSTVSESGFIINKFDSGIRVDQVATAKEYNNVLAVRHLAYLSANKISTKSKPDDMCDEYDKRSVIYCAKLNQAVVGTIRITFSDSETEAFPFEKYYSKDKLPPIERAKSVELCRLAIHPKFQGTDVVIALLRSTSRECVTYVQNCFALATESVSHLYKALGFRQVTDFVNHPHLKNEKMCVLKLYMPDYLNGKNIRAITWDLIVKDSINDVSQFGIVNPAGNKLKFDILRVVEKGHKKYFSKKKEK